jgi:hypothetical protein
LEIKMREDGDFIQDLRKEILNSQERRGSYTRQKLTFLISLLGVGNLAIANLNTAVFLYITPIIAFVFDLWILGENYGIRRAGIFIKKSPNAPNDERLWEETVTANRDSFSSIAGQLSSILILVAAAITLYKIENNLFLFWVWSIATLMSVITIWSINSTRNNTLKKIDAFIELKRKV